MTTLLVHLDKPHPVLHHPLSIIYTLVLDLQKWISRVIFPGGSKGAVQTKEHLNTLPKPSKMNESSETLWRLKLDEW